MIDKQRYRQALTAMQKLITHAKSQAYSGGATEVAELLNDIELLPEFLAEDLDRTDQFVEMLESIAQTHPTCRYIVEQFLEAPIRTP
jgi:hypothetical protein